jgi:hypothetical protein
MRTTPARADAVLADVLGRRAAEHRGQLFALFEGGSRLTSGELATRAWTIAAALRERHGVCPIAWIRSGWRPVSRGESIIA